MREKLIVDHITKMFSESEGIKDLSFSVYDKELLTLLGPSGCGKTTVLRAIGGFNYLDSGRIVLDGAEIQGVPPEKRPTGMVFQSYNLWPHMTVFENMSFGLKIRKQDKNTIKDKVEKALDLVGMGGSEDKFPSQLSGGQQQRVAIARSLVLEPSILLLDEPFSALDAKIRSYMREELKRIQKEAEITIIFVTHDQEEAMSISDRIAVMKKGNIEQIGSPSQIYDSPKTRFVADFIGEMNFIERNGETVAVRPEDINIKKNEKGEYKILNLMNLGHYSSALLERETGQEIKVYLTKGEIELFSIEDRVELKIEKEQVYKN